MTLPAGIVEALAHIVGANHVRLTQEDCGGRTPSPRGSQSPDAIVFPGSTDELAELVRGAAACDIAVRTAHGTTLLDGDSGHVVLSQRRLSRILEINRNQLTCRLQPEVLLGHLRRRLTAAGLTIASIPCASGRDTTVANSVRALKAVTSTGTVVDANRAAQDGHFDVVDLLMRMAGTSCLLAELTVELVPTSLCGNQPGRKEPL